MSQHGAGPFFPFFDQERGLRYAYDARSDSIRFENGEYMPRPPQFPRTMVESPSALPSSEDIEILSQTPANRPEIVLQSSFTGTSNKISYGGRSAQPVGFPSTTYGTPGLEAWQPAASTKSALGLPSVQTVGPTSARMPLPASSDLAAGGAYDPSSFRARRANFFCIGRVFLVLWSEPVGENLGATTLQGASSQTLSRGMSSVMYGERVYSEVRRFVVIRTGGDGRYCNALPLTTYGGRGVSKVGVLKYEHAIVHCTRQAPKPRNDELPQSGEAGMQLQPIQVTRDLPEDTLDPMTRIDYGKVHTIHHNIRIKSLGVVHPNSITALEHQFWDVWRPPGPGGLRLSQRSVVKLPAAIEAAGNDRDVNRGHKLGAASNGDQQVQQNRHDSGNARDVYNGHESGAASNEDQRVQQNRHDKSSTNTRSGLSGTEATRAQSIRTAVSQIMQQGQTQAQAIQLVAQRLMASNASFTLQSAGVFVRNRIAYGQSQQAQDGADKQDVTDEDNDGDSDDSSKDEHTGENKSTKVDTSDVSYAPRSVTQGVGYSYRANLGSDIGDDCIGRNGVQAQEPSLSGSAGSLPAIPEDNSSIVLSDPGSVLSNGVSSTSIEFNFPAVSSDDPQSSSDFETEDEYDAVALTRLRVRYAPQRHPDTASVATAVDIMVSARLLNEQIKSSRTISTGQPDISLTPLLERTERLEGALTNVEQCVALASAVAKSCWLPDILPASLLTFTERGFAIPVERLFHERLFVDGYLSTRPSWLESNEGFPVDVTELNDLDEIELGMAGLYSALNLLARSGYGNGNLSIIVESAVRTNVAEVVRLSASDLHAESLSAILHLFGVGSYCLGRDDLQLTRAAIRLCALTAVSYATSHCCDFRQAVWPHFGLQVLADKEVRYFVYEQRRLACLEEDIGGPVWMAASGTNATDVPHAISLSLLDYADLWGPLTVLRSSDDSQVLTAIHSERGMVYRQKKTAFAAVDNEVPCHWTRTWLQCRTDVSIDHELATGLSMSRHEALPAAPLTFHAESRLLIGNPTAGVETMLVPNLPVKDSLQDISYPSSQRIRRRRRSERAAARDPGLVSNVRCGLTVETLKNSKHLHLAPVDTSIEKLVPDSYTIGGNAGFHVVVLGTKTFKYSPGKTYKCSLLNSLKSDHPVITSARRLLELRIGLADDYRIREWIATVIFEFGGPLEVKHNMHGYPRALLLGSTSSETM
ncbi:hypothetical protein LTR97_008611 [Elasticomyces elasticus]|uniref:DUF6590 domain-containing protein n=1 Tax=Elasticomyces elasticus TaxID=574655 RepID=A0AAN7VZ89_9PEZI|nr:hypothetical protein LTR97_008611 [Elasticomyces elasticus]